MKIGEALAEAVKSQNARKAGAIADSLRARGMNYADVYAFAHRHTAVSAEEWEALMLEADEGDDA